MDSQEFCQLKSLKLSTDLTKSARKQGVISQTQTIKVSLCVSEGDSLLPIARGAWASKFEFEKPADLAPAYWSKIANWFSSASLPHKPLLASKCRTIIEALRVAGNSPIKTFSLFGDSTSSAILLMNKCFKERSTEVVDDGKFLFLATSRHKAQLWIIKKV